MNQTRKNDNNIKLIKSPHSKQYNKIMYNKNLVRRDKTKLKLRASGAT